MPLPAEKRCACVGVGERVAAASARSEAVDSPAGLSFDGVTGGGGGGFRIALRISSGSAAAVAGGGGGGGE